MMKRGRDLNQSLEKGLFRLFRCELHRFPVLVRLKEQPGTEAAQALV